jgi:hypothetical protein
MRSFIISTVCISALLITGADQVFSQDGWNMELIGKAAYDGSILNFLVCDEYLFIGASKGTFSVIEISNPDSPHRIGTFAKHVAVWEFLIVDTLLYMSINPGGVIIYDIQDPSSPVELATIEEDRGFGTLTKMYNSFIGSAKLAQIIQQYFYLLKISDPLDPQIAASFEVDHAVTDFEFFRNYLLLVEFEYAPRSYHFEIYDLSEITDPQRIYSSQIETAAYYLRLDVIEDYAYIYYGVSGIQIYDISNIPEVELVNTAFEGEQIVDTAVDGDILFVTKKPNSLLTLDISDPVNPTISNEYVCYPITGGLLENLVVYEDILYFVAAGDVLSFYDVSDPDSPSLLGRYIADTQYSNLARSANYAYMGGLGLRIFDIGDPADPVGVNWYFLPDQTRYCFTRNELLFVVNNYDVVIYSLNDPRYPEYLSTVFTDFLVNQVYADNPFLYIANDADGFSIVDISDPLSPNEIGHFPSEHPFNYYRSIVAYDDYVYTAEKDSGIGIYNIAEPANPVKVLAFTDPPNPTFVFYSNDMLYVADHYDGLLILDVSDPTNPFLMGTYEFEEAYNIFVEGDIAYVAARSNGLKVFDVSDPSAPELIGRYEDSGYCWGVMVENDTAYVSSAVGGGLRILRYTGSTQDIPTLSEWGMIILTLLLLAFGTLTVIRRRYYGSHPSGWRQRDILREFRRPAEKPSGPADP